MPLRLFSALFCALLLARTAQAATPATFNVLDYGAVPDGKTKNTAAFAKAVAA